MLGRAVPPGQAAPGGRPHPGCSRPTGSPAPAVPSARTLRALLPPGGLEAWLQSMNICPQQTWFVITLCSQVARLHFCTIQGETCFRPQAANAEEGFSVSL